MLIESWDWEALFEGQQGKKISLEGWTTQFLLTDIQFWGHLAVPGFSSFTRVQMIAQKGNSGVSLISISHTSWYVGDRLQNSSAAQTQGIKWGASLA
jgi:hypothetical protein